MEIICANKSGRERRIQGCWRWGDSRELVPGGNFRHLYLNAFPTGYVGYVPNDKNSFTLSYGRGIGRPSYLDLNPFRYKKWLKK